MPLRTPLYDFHVRHGAKMVDFAGWEMPIMYGRSALAGEPPVARGALAGEPPVARGALAGEPPVAQGGSIVEEHRQVRTSGGLFDVSHMGRVKVTGRHSRRFLERLCTRRISDMEAGQCRYSLVCNERGGVRDDIIVSKIDDDDYFLVVNASNREKLLTHFAEIKGDLVVNIEDRTMKTAMVALQGPKVMPEVIAKYSKEIPTLKRYRFVEKNYLILKFMVSRTGYTGEDGVEVVLPATGVEMALKLLLKDVDMTQAGAVVRPTGLGARDTLRLEAGMPLYGHELGEETPALASGLDFALQIDKDKDERGESYVGMDALKRLRDAGGPPRKLVGLFIEGKRTARQGMRILDKPAGSGGREVGEITSGCNSPTLGRCIAMGYVDRALSEKGTKMVVDSGRGEMMGAEVTALPFYKAGK